MMTTATAMTTRTTPLVCVNVSTGRSVSDEERASASRGRGSRSPNVPRLCHRSPLRRRATTTSASGRRRHVRGHFSTPSPSRLASFHFVHPPLSSFSFAVSATPANREIKSSPPRLYLYAKPRTVPSLALHPLHGLINRLSLARPGTFLYRVGHRFNPRSGYCASRTRTAVISLSPSLSWHRVSTC